MKTLAKHIGLAVGL